MSATEHHCGSAVRAFRSCKIRNCIPTCIVTTTEALQSHKVPRTCSVMRERGRRTSFKVTMSKPIRPPSCCLTSSVRNPHMRRCGIFVCSISVSLRACAQQSPWQPARQTISTSDQEFLLQHFCEPAIKCTHETLAPVLQTKLAKKGCAHKSGGWIRPTPHGARNRDPDVQRPLCELACTCTKYKWH